MPFPPLPSQPQAPIHSFPALKHALDRRDYDFHHGILTRTTTTVPTRTRQHPLPHPHPQPQPSLDLHFYDLAQKVWAIEDALLNRSPSSHHHAPAPALIDARILPAMDALTADAVAFNKDIELNPLRLHRRATNAMTEDALRAARVEKFEKWKGVLEGVEAEIEAARRRRRGSKL